MNHFRSCVTIVVPEKSWFRFLCLFGELVNTYLKSRVFRLVSTTIAGSLLFIFCLLLFNAEPTQASSQATVSNLRSSITAELIVSNNDILAPSHQKTLSYLYAPDQLQSSPGFTEVFFDDLLEMTTGIAWGDMEGDGDLDLAISNAYWWYPGISRVYANDGTGIFSEVAQFDASNSNVAWGDMDGDGDLDLAFGNGNLYRNLGDHNFTLSQQIVGGTMAWGDMNGDGDLDLAVGTNLYTNDGSGFFTFHSLLNPDNALSVVWGDMDGDGDLDLAASSPINGGQNHLYINDGSATFTQQDRFGSDGTSLAWGDMDNDGDLDLAVGKHDSAVNQLYRNEGNGNFSEYGTFGGGSTNSVAWGDMDNDGDLDLAVGGGDWVSGEVTRLFENDGTGVFSEVVGDMQLDGTNQVAWGDMDNDGDLDLAVANGTNINNGYIETNRIYRNDLPLVFSEMQIEGSGEAAWGDVDRDGDLDLATGNSIYQNEQGTFTLLDTLTVSVYSSSDMAWGDFDGDNNLDLSKGGELFRNDGTGQFSLFASQASGTVWGDWGDMDGDGDLDLAGRDLFRNEGGGIFTPLNIYDLWEATTAWGDMDGDGDLDLALGYHYGGQNYLLRNDGNDIFTQLPRFGTKNTNSMAWGDMDGDGDLDLALGNGYFEARQLNEIYRNDGNATFTKVSGALGLQVGQTSDIAWGDMDGDGDLDLVVSTFDIWPSDPVTRFYENDGFGNFKLMAELPRLGSSVAWGDFDGNGNLDLVASGSSNIAQLYRNLRHAITNSLPNNPFTISLKPPESLGITDFYGVAQILESQTISIPFSLFDAEGDSVGQLQAYYSLNGGGQWLPAIASPNTAINKLDSSGLRNIIGYWPFDEGTLTTTVDASDHGMTASLVGPSWATATTPILGENPHALSFDGINDYVEVAHDPRQNPGEELTLAVWVKLDDVIRDSKILGKGWIGSGYVLGVRNGSLNPEIWDSNGNPHWLSAGTINAGDWTHLAVTWQLGGYMHAYVNGELVSTLPATNNPIASTTQPVRIGVAPWTTTAHQADGSIDDARIYNRALSPTEIASLAIGRCVRGCNHVFMWDTYASGFFGQSDNVVFRLEAYPQPSVPAITGTYKYTSTVPGPFQRTFASATTFPFRVRGTQVQVFTGTVAPNNELAGAIVYRLPDGQADGAAPMANELNSQVWQTEANGYLQGRGRLAAGDQIMALYPISSTTQYTIYQTSAAPTATGLDLFTVTQPGVQQLAISPNNKLILFNLVVSLEWDARQDTTFMAQLKHDIQRTSQVLYDITNGQAALGRVHIYHDRGYWGEADVVIAAANTIRPSAILGGIVITPTNDIVSSTLTITNAFIPGQVRMPPEWNRFGNPSGTLGEDWPRTLAHELSHYLFYHADNYLGLSENGLLKLVECPGSVMSDPYVYDEFLTAAEWNDPQHTDCQQTLSEYYLGRSDWETVQQFYPTLNTAGTNVGPTSLPLAVTQITVMPYTATMSLDAPFFRLIDETGEPAPIPEGRAQAFLIRPRASDVITDDYIIAQGTPIGDILNARGAAPGDRLCVFDYSQEPLRVGCQDVGSVATPVTLYPTPGWAPQIRVSPVSTDTVVVTVTDVSDNSLMVQLMPASGRASEAVAMVRQGDVFTQTVTAPDGAYYGYVRLWVPSSNPRRETIVEFVGSDDWGGRSYAWGADPYDWRSPAYGWGGRSYAWGGRSYAWGGRSYAWGAPVMSNDGQVSVFPLENLFGENADFSLQQLLLPPTLDSWLTPVGQAYRFEAGQPLSGTAAILFQYLAQDVPPGYENLLEIYYSPNEGQTWQRLTTELDSYRNIASAMMPEEGLYILAATVEVAPGFAEGWNNFGYPIQGTRPITEALASIEGKYTAVANYDPSRAEPWQTYYVTVTAPFNNVVNTLPDLAFTRAYWLYATEAITLYVEPPHNSEIPLTGLQLPPATFYGWITPTTGFNPTEGMPVTAWIGEYLCGEGTVQDMEAGQLGYSLQVVSENIYGTPNGCGELGQTVQFRVGSWVMNHDHAWENEVAHYHSLAQPFTPVSGLAASNNSPTPFGYATTLTATIAAGDAVAYIWDFGDGSLAASGAVVSHDYPAVGVYTATVTASNPANSLIATTVVEIINIPPTAVADQYTTAEDVPLAVSAPGVLGNDSDVNGDELSATVIEAPENGTVILNLDGSFVYTPTQDFNGEETFRYRISDGVLVDTAVVTITVAPVNDPPVVIGDSDVTDEDTAVTTDVLLNDSDVDGNLNPASVTIISGPGHGTTTVNPSTGAVSYTPLPNFNGLDSYDYRVCDDGYPLPALCAIATVIVTVTAVNDAPIAVDDTAVTPEDTPRTIAVLGNDSDPDGDLLTIVSVTAPIHGTVTIDGSMVIYTPTLNFDGQDIFGYVISDGDVTDTATVTVTIGPLNDAPTANADATETDEDVSVVIAVLENDTDPENDTLTVTNLGTPISGTVNTDGATVTYTPAPDFYGTDSFTYTVSDGELEDTAVVTVVVQPINDPPLVNAGDDQIVEEGSLLSFGGVFADDAPPGSYASIFWDFGDGATATGILTPTHTYPENGVYTATLIITDAVGAVGTDFLLMTVTNVAPTVNAGIDLTTTVGIPVSFNGTFSDPGTIDTHTFEWNFGDGITTTTTLMPVHAYLDPGTYSVTLTVVDDDGGEMTDGLVVAVSGYNIFLPVIVRWE